ncbi:MAG TPA: RHS repeat-associated core domain-containing protein, partial [Chitinophagales bacterium]|nr:RHS repeat-associated core domain-containing protein [Chitinophagales bacterium]
EDNYFYRSLGEKRYELSNHLGNVLSVISDRRLAFDTDANGTTNYYEADVISAQDYDPFGMLLVGRSWSVSYRYGFNGKEMDAETYGQGNIYDYGFRIYNPRLGKFLSIDPFQKKYPSLTPFALAFNSPLMFIDNDGRDGKVAVIGDPINGGGKIVISSTFYITGKGVTPSKVKRLNKEAQKLFLPGTFVDDNNKVWAIEFDINYEFIPEPDCQLANYENIIETSKAINRSHAHTGQVETTNSEELCGNLVITNTVQSITLGQKIKLNVGANFTTIFHESLHTLGLIDRYYENKFIETSIAGQNVLVNKPYEGYENSIMGNNQSGIIIQEHYDDFGKTFGELGEGIYHLNYFLDASERPSDTDQGYSGTIQTTFIQDRDGKSINFTQNEIDNPKPKTITK